MKTNHEPPMQNEDAMSAMSIPHPSALAPEDLERLTGYQRQGDRAVTSRHYLRKPRIMVPLR